MVQSPFQKSYIQKGQPVTKEPKQSRAMYVCVVVGAGWIVPLGTVAKAVAMDGVDLPNLKVALMLLVAVPAPFIDVLGTGVTRAYLSFPAVLTCRSYCRRPPWLIV